MYHITRHGIDTATYTALQQVVATVQQWKGSNYSLCHLHFHVSWWIPSNTYT